MVKPEVFIVEMREGTVRQLEQSRAKKQVTRTSPGKAHHL